MAFFSQTATDLSPKGYGRLRSKMCIRDSHYGGYVPGDETQY